MYLAVSPRVAFLVHHSRVVAAQLGPLQAQEAVASEKYPLRSLAHAKLGNIKVGSLHDAAKKKQVAYRAPAEAGLDQMSSWTFLCLL